jgi:hypothetical protein
MLKPPNRSDFSAQVYELDALGLIPHGGIHPAVRDQAFGNGVVIMSEFAEVKLNRVRREAWSASPPEAHPEGP